MIEKGLESDSFPSRKTLPEVAFDLLTQERIHNPGEYDLISGRGAMLGILMKVEKLAASIFPPSYSPKLLRKLWMHPQVGHLHEYCEQ